MALPSVGVSTPLAFRELDAKMAAGTLPQGLKPMEGEAGFVRAEALTYRSVLSGGSSPQHVTLTSGASVDKLEELSRVLSAVFTTGVKEPGPSGISRTASPVTESSKDIGTAIDLAENTLLALVRTGIENDFEEVAFSQHPFLRDIKRQLMGSDSGNPAMYAGLSGSGSALFGLYKSEADALAAQHRVQSNGTQAILTETLPRTEYWSGMFAE